MSNLQTCWRQTVCQNRLRTASPQGIDAQASQGSVAPLTEQSDETFSVWQFFLLTENEAPQDARYSRQERMKVRPLVPKGFLSVRQTGIINLGFDQIYFHFDVFLIFCICKSLRFSNVVKYTLV